jgi:TPR repeat protein
MISRLLLSLLAVVFVLGASPSVAQERLALVIGNQDYASVPKLSRARNDAEAIGAVLKGLGFDVTQALDADEAAMADAIDGFVGKVSPGDTVVVHYSGHGVEIDGHNYLLPVDAPSPETASDVRLKRSAFDLRDALIDPIRRKGARVTFAVIDACRDNPYVAATRSIGGTRGLGRMEAEEGEFLLFSAQPGQKALDSLPQDDSETTSVFTRVLIRHLGKPGQPLVMIAKATQEEVKALARDSAGFSQFPDYVDRIVGMAPLVEGPGAQGDTVQLAAKPETPAAPTLVPEPAVRSTPEATDPAATELAHLDRTDPAVLRDFITRHPTASSATAEAKRLLADLAKQPQPCDQLAGAPDVIGSPTGIAGITFARINGEAAVEACAAASLQFPEEPRFTTWLGRAYDKLRRYEKSFPLYLNAAERGHVRAMTYLGNAYRYGEGVARDPTEAVIWYRKAAGLGDHGGMTNLGMMYADGEGVAKDPLEAVRWYRMAVDLGEPTAMNNLAVLYSAGSGIAKDPAQAAQLFRRAAESGEASAMGNLAMALNDGNGVPVDPAEAAQWLLLCIANGDQTQKDQILRGKGSRFRKQTRVEVQKLLIDRGLLSGRADGSFGAQTIAAIESLYESAR